MQAPRPGRVLGWKRLDVTGEPKLGQWILTDEANNGPALVIWARIYGQTN